jgi:hypothetical protein
MDCGSNQPSVRVGFSPPGKARHDASGPLFRPDTHGKAPNLVISARCVLAFTVAPHLQIINYRSGFSRFVGI